MINRFGPYGMNYVQPEEFEGKTQEEIRQMNLERLDDNIHNAKIGLAISLCTTIVWITLVVLFG